MPRPSNQMQTFDGQVRFNGGMNELEPGPNQFFWGKNIVIRDGYAATRPGIRRAFRETGFTEAFYFNEGNAKYNDATHTGFWFPFEFAATIWNNIQGADVVRLPQDEQEVLLIAQDGKVYKNSTGYVSEIPTSVTIGTDEVINFTQANDYIFMWRGESLDPLYWDGSPTGFIAVPDADTQSDIPQSSDAIYLLSRLWAYRDRSEVGASDILDFNDWDRVYSVFNVAPGDGDEIVALWPFHDDKIIVFKRNRIFGMSGLTGATLSDTLATTVIDTQRGAVASNAMTTFGEHIAFVGYGNIYDMIRNEENRMRGIDLPISWPISRLLARVNWGNSDALEDVSAITYNNYLLFAVPIDSSPTNNAILVYDILGNDGNGAWCGLWQSGQTNVKKFFIMRGLLYFLGYDSVVRQMFVDVPWDSDPEDVFIDTQTYDATRQYYAGEYAYKLVDGTNTLYLAVRDSLGQDLTDTDYWSAVADPVHAYDIETELITRQYKHEDTSPKLLARCEVLYKHQDPKVSLYARAEDYETEETLFTDVEQSQVEYDIALTDDWDDSNTNLDFRDPHRKDYTVYIPEDESYICMDVTGIDFGVWEEHSMRFIKRLLNDRSFALRILNTRGKISIRSILAAAQLKRFASKAR